MNELDKITEAIEQLNIFLSSTEFKKLDKLIRIEHIQKLGFLKQKESILITQILVDQQR